MKRPRFVADEHLDYLDELAQRGIPKEDWVRFLVLKFERLTWGQAQQIVEYWMMTLK